MERTTAGFQRRRSISRFSRTRDMSDSVEASFISSLSITAKSSAKHYRSAFDEPGRGSRGIDTASARKGLRSTPRYPRNPRRVPTNRTIGHNGAITSAARPDRIFPLRKTVAPKLRQCPSVRNMPAP